MRDHFKNIGLPWEYTNDIWDEEEVHQNAQTYDELIFNRHVQSKGRILDEEKDREAKKKVEEE